MSVDVDVKKTDLIGAYFGSFLSSNINSVGKVVKGKVVNIDRKKGIVVVEAGLRCDAVLSIKEFYRKGESENLKIGDTVDLYVTSNDNIGKTSLLSRENAIREESKLKVLDALEKDEIIEGIPFAKVKSGLSVDIDGFIAFLPGSQISADGVLNEDELIGKRQKFKVVSFDGKNAVLSRKMVLDENYKGERETFYETHQEGSIIEGKVRNLTDYGVFVDLGFGVDALIHLSDISWNRISHPSEIVSIGEVVKAKIIKLDRENNKIAASMKVLTENDWLKSVKIEVGSTIKGKISRIDKYGLFVELPNNLEGLVHLSEISWENAKTDKLSQYNVGDEIETMVVDIDGERQRVVLSIKRLLRNPFKEFADQNTFGSQFEGEITKIIDYGFFVAVNEIEGFVSIDNLGWLVATDILSNYKVGDKVKVVYLSIDDKFTKIAFGIKQLTENPFEKENSPFVVGKAITCEVLALKPDRIDVKVGDGVYASIKKSNLSRERLDQRIDRFTIGDKIDAKILALDVNAKKLILSIKDLEEDEYKKIIEKYGAEDTGASIADVLGIKTK